MEETNEIKKNKAHLFTLRVWAVNEGETAPQWRSRLQDIQSGEVNYFKDLEALRSFIDQRLHEENQESHSFQKDKK